MLARLSTCRDAPYQSGEGVCEGDGDGGVRDGDVVVVVMAGRLHGGGDAGEGGGGVNEGDGGAEGGVRYAFDEFDGDPMLFLVDGLDVGGFVVGEDEVVGTGDDGVAEFCGKAFAVVLFAEGLDVEGGIEGGKEVFGPVGGFGAEFVFGGRSGGGGIEGYAAQAPGECARFVDVEAS